MLDRLLVLGLVDDFDGRPSNIFIVVANELQHGIHDLGTTDRRQRVRCSRADPPVVILEGNE